MRRDCADWDAGISDPVRMANAAARIRSLGGVARVAALRRAGATEADVRTAIRDRQLLRIRKGWVHTPDAAPILLRAVALGGRVACISAARLLGLWTPDDDGALHLARPAHAGRTYGDPANVVEHWQSDPWRMREEAVESIPNPVRQVLLCCSREVAITIIDSALNKRVLTRAQLKQVVATLPAGLASVLEDVDGASESGLETLCRLSLVSLGARVRTQVFIRGVGRLDLIVEDRLVVEADGRAWHDSPGAFYADRNRDIRLIALGYVVIRLSYQQVVHEWPLVELALSGLMSRREHLWSRAHRLAGLAP